MRFVLFFLGVFFSFNSLAYYQTDNRMKDPSSSSMAGISFFSKLYDAPSTSANQDSLSAYICYCNPYFLPELSSFSGLFHLPANFFYINFNVSYFGYSNYNESSFGVSISKKLSSKFNLGARLRYLNVYYEGCENRLSKLTTDIGADYKVGEKWHLFASLKNLAQTELYSSADYLYQPFETLLGFSLNIIDNVKWGIEVSNLDFTEWNVRNGLAYSFENFIVRCGFLSSPLTPTVGVGFSFKGFLFDVGTQYHNMLGYSLSVGLGKTF